MWQFVSSPILVFGLCCHYLFGGKWCLCVRSLAKWFFFSKIIGFSCFCLFILCIFFILVEIFFSTFTSNYTPLDWIIGFQIARNKTSTANQNFFFQTVFISSTHNHRMRCQSFVNLYACMTVNGSFINIDFIHQISKTVDSFFTMAPYEFIASDVGDKIKNPFCLLWMQWL